MAASHKELSTAEIAYAAIEEVLSLFSIKSLYFRGEEILKHATNHPFCLLYTSPSPRDKRQSRMPSSA